MNTNNPHQTERPLSVEQVRAVDRYAIEQLGIAGIVLMENAGRNCTDCIERRLGADRAGHDQKSVSIICGKGNNGGDGFVIARHLAHRGHEVNIDLYGQPDELSGDAEINFRIIEKMQLPIHYSLKESDILANAHKRWQKSDLIVDALLGTGFSGQVHPPLSEVIDGITALAGPMIVSVDVPSGLDADTGQPGGTAVRADQTVTFVARKRGFDAASAGDYLGQVTVVDIGAPTELILSKINRS